MFLTYCRLLKQTSWMKFVSTFTLLTEFLTQHQSLSVLHTKWDVKPFPVPLSISKLAQWKCNDVSFFQENGLLLSLIENNTVLFFACLFLFLPMIQWHNNSRKEKYLIWPFIKSFSIHCIFGNCEEELPKKPVGQLSVNCRPTANQQVKKKEKLC